MKEYSSGYYKVPSVGAGTANTEFETITGMSLHYFGPGEYPYKSILIICFLNQSDEFSADIFAQRLIKYNLDAAESHVADPHIIITDVVFHLC